MNFLQKLFLKKSFVLEKNKVYVVKVTDKYLENSDNLHDWADYLKDLYGIEIVFILEGMKFVELPKGYTINKI